MKVLAISDIHGYVDLLLKVLEKEATTNIDLILFAGDVAPYKAPYRTRDYLLRVLDIVKMYRVKLFVAVPGNMDIPEHYNEISSEIYVNIHNKFKEFGKVMLIGFGGSTKTSFSTFLEYSDDFIERSLLSLYKDVMSIIKRGQPLVLLTHTPPYNTKCDTAYTGEHIGSLGVRRFIESAKPLLAVCGHVHESRCVDVVSMTTVVNPGPLYKGFYALIEIKGEKVNVFQRSLT